MYHPDELAKIINLVEEEVFQLDIIKSFEERGWGLYEVCPVDVDFTLKNYFDLKLIVETGREKKSLKYGVRYVLLPLNKQDTNWEIIRDMIFMLTSQGRGPFFVDFQEGKDDDGEKFVEPIGVYLIDTVYLDPPEIVLVIDPRMSRIRYPKKQSIVSDNMEIRIHLGCLDVIRKQLMMSLRII